MSIALPGSIIAKYLAPLPSVPYLLIRTSAQSPELKSQLAGQIARALAVFCVDEVVVFEDGQNHGAARLQIGFSKDDYTGYSNPNYFLMHILSYLETPPYLRQRLFPMHPDLQKAGALPSLDLPHHLRSHERCQYREGFTIAGPEDSKDADGIAEEQGKKKKKRKEAKGSGEIATLVDVGFGSPVTVPSTIPPNSRVTLKLSDSEHVDDDGPKMTAQAVAPSVPREEAGYYWGYSVRSAASLSAVLTESPFHGGYDLTFGTSERGLPLSSLTKPSADQAQVPAFKHMLIVFGGVAGLEVAVKTDDELLKIGVTEPSGLFDYWINLCPGQGSRTIRTEEAVWLGLMGLRDLVVEKGIK